jgi:hypothetical protein
VERGPGCEFQEFFERAFERVWSRVGHEV